LGQVRAPLEDVAGRPWNMLSWEVFKATVARDRSRRRFVLYMERMNCTTMPVFAVKGVLGWRST
jgi:hypothetical protein